MSRSIRSGVAAACVMASCLVGAVAWSGDTTSVVLARAFIPSADNVHGETQVRRNGEGACCVRTILHSPSFRRGIREILEKEAALWPEHKTGYEDSLRYREALERAKQAILSEPRADDQAGSPYTMVMDFMFEPERSVIEISRGEVVLDDTGFAVMTNAAIARLDVSDAYMSRALLVMTATALGPERHDAAQILTAAGWLDLSETPDPSAPAPVR